MSNGSERPKFGAGLLVGTLIGIVAGILLAPQAGGETREQLKEKALDARDQAEDIIDTAREIAEEAIEEGKEVAAKTKIELEDKLDDIKNQ
jgi:gas vesicle protein